MDLTEAEDIKKRWQEYTEELYKKELHDPDNHEGVITHIQLSWTSWNVKSWASRSIITNKASEGDGIPVELFQILKDDAVATAEFSKFAGLLSAALSKHHLSGFEIVQLEFHHLH